METIKLTRDFKEFLSLLNSEKINYLLIGGYAVMLYGHIRRTKDIDIWVAIDPANEARLIEALVKFGFRRESLKLPLFQGKQTVLRMGLPPNRLEVISEIAGVEFQDCFQRRQIMNIEGIDVPVISLDDLIRNKQSTGRHQDQADVEHLKRRGEKP